MGFGEVAMAALYFVLRFGLAFSDRLGGGTRMRPTDVRIRLAFVGRFLVWANRSRMRAGNLHCQWQEGKEEMTSGLSHGNSHG